MGLKDGEGESSRTGSRRPRRDERRAQILSAARQVFAQKGYHAATVDDITKKAGVAKGTFYLYFSEKPAIYYELIKCFFDMVTEIGRSVSRNVTDDAGYMAQVEHAVREIVTLFRENKDLVRLVYRESMGMDERLEKMVADFYRSVAQVEIDNFVLGRSLGLFSEDLEPAIVAYAHIGLIERVLLTATFEEGFPQQDLVQQLLKLLHSSIKRRESR